MRTGAHPIKTEDQGRLPLQPFEVVLLGGPILATGSEREIRSDPMSVRILLVDDSVTLRERLRLLLESHADWEICGEAADGIEAIQKYRQLSPDLLLVDVSMPRMNGLDASMEILRLSPKIPILLYTSYLTAQLIESAHKAGIRGTVSKDATHLLVVGLETVLRGEEFSSPPN
jgi:DNA-binding NarL/FixJ family response regulator